MLVRPYTHVTEHLYRFGILNLNMVLFNYGLSEVLVNQFPEGSPLLAILHDQEMVA